MHMLAHELVPLKSRCLVLLVEESGLSVPLAVWPAASSGLSKPLLLLSCEGQVGLDGGEGLRLTV